MQNAQIRGGRLLGHYSHHRGRWGRAEEGRRHQDRSARCTEGAQERAVVKAIAKRLRRLEDQFGPADGKRRFLLAVCNAGWGLALDRDTCIQILGEAGFLPRVLT
jgi:hypothetical protein